MSEGQPWDYTHVTTMVVTVDYSHGVEGWRAAYQVHLHHMDGEPTPLGSARTEFGPFDSYIEVGYWLAGLAKILKTMTADRRPAEPQSPPQGTTAPPISDGGR